MTARCSTGKVGHPTRKTAAVAARRIKDKGRPAAHVYDRPCPDCGLWHVGTSPLAQPAPAAAFRVTRQAVPDDAPGTRYCQQDGCGHKAVLHGLGACLGAHGTCRCSELVTK